MKSLIIAPHPDDEVLGPGGTLFKRQKKQGNKQHRSSSNTRSTKKLKTGETQNEF